MVPGAGAREPGPSQAREPASRRKWVPPSPPPAPPPAAASSPVTGASSAHVCETSPAGPGERDRPKRRDGNPAAPALCRRGAGRGTGRGRKGQGGEAGQGQARGPARKAPALGPRGRRRCLCQDAPRPKHQPHWPLTPDSPRPSPTLLPAPPPLPPTPLAPLLPGVTNPQIGQAQPSWSPSAPSTP